MSKIKLSKEDLAELRITNSRHFEIYKKSINDFREKYGMEPHEFEDPFGGVSEMMQRHLESQAATYKARGIDVGISDSEASAAILERYPIDSGISDAMRTHLELQYKNNKK